MLLAVILFYLKLETVKLKVTEMKNQKKVKPDEEKKSSDTLKSLESNPHHHKQFGIISVRE